MSDEDMIDMVVRRFTYNLNACDAFMNAYKEYSQEGSLFPEVAAAMKHKAIQYLDATGLSDPIKAVALKCFLGES